MKRVYFLILLFISFSLCGCKFFSNLFGGDDDDELVTQTVYTQTKGDVYLVKLNNSNEIIKGENTGYVTEVSRSAVEENKEYNDTDFYVRDLNNKVNEFLIKESSSRVAQLTIGNGVKTLNDEKDDTNDFYVFVSDDKLQKVPCVCKYVTNHCIVYADKDNSRFNINDLAYEKIAKKFENCYVNETSIIGSPIYESYVSDYCVPCTSKITIVVSDLFRDGKQKDNQGTVGYHYTGDFFKQEVFEQSNEREIFYVDAAFLAEDEDYIYTTEVHEFNHLINFVIKTINRMTANKTVPNKTQTCDVWFTEMLAMTTEDMFQSYLNLDDMHTPKARLPYFGLGYYYGFTSWKNQKLDPLIMYANTYAFGAFLARNFGGINLIKQIAQNNYVNEEAITKALQTLYPNQGYDFTYALRKFTLCVVNTDYNKDYTLNRSTGLNSDKLGFTAVNIKESIQYNGKTYNIPLIFKSDEDGQLDLYPYGFTVHYVDTNISSFELVASTNDSLEYYCVEK